MDCFQDVRTLFFSFIEDVFLLLSWISVTLYEQLIDFFVRTLMILFSYACVNIHVFLGMLGTFFASVSMSSNQVINFLAIAIVIIVMNRIVYIAVGNLFRCQWFRLTIWKGAYFSSDTKNPFWWLIISHYFTVCSMILWDNEMELYYVNFSLANCFLKLSYIRLFWIVFEFVEFPGYLTNLTIVCLRRNFS